MNILQYKKSPMDRILAILNRKIVRKIVKCCQFFYDLDAVVGNEGGGRESPVADLAEDDLPS